MGYKFAIVAVLALQCYTVCSGRVPCACARNLKPVCGSDGVTYGNECTLECHNYNNNANVTVARAGSCEEETCFCTYEYKPVCASDGNTYPNACAMRCAPNSKELRVSHDGECVTPVKIAPNPCVCTDELAEVCATNGLTYGNKCLFECAQRLLPELQIAHEAACPERPSRPLTAPAPGTCACARDLKPVCGTDGRTYNNLCLLKCAGEQVSLARMGPCDA